MAEKLYFTKGCKFHQQATLFCTIFVLLIFILFLRLEYSRPMLWIVFINAAIAILLNLCFGKLYEIRAEGETIIIENMWKKAQYRTQDLIDIHLVHFLVYYPFNPYLKFVFTDKKEFVAVMPQRFKNYLSYGGIDRYINNLKEKLSVPSN